MDKQPRMIDADKAIESLNEAIKNSIINSEEGTNPWFRGEMNGLGFAKAIILSGQCDPDPIPLPAIKVGDRVRHKVHGIGSVKSFPEECVDVNFDEVPYILSKFVSALEVIPNGE